MPSRSRLDRDERVAVLASSRPCPPGGDASGSGERDRVGARNAESLELALFAEVVREPVHALTKASSDRSLPRVEIRPRPASVSATMTRDADGRGAVVRRHAGAASSSRGATSRPRRGRPCGAVMPDAQRPPLRRDAQRARDALGPIAQPVGLSPARTTPPPDRPAIVRWTLGRLRAETQDDLATGARAPTVTPSALSYSGHAGVGDSGLAPRTRKRRARAARGEASERAWRAIEAAHRSFNNGTCV